MEQSTGREMSDQEIVLPDAGQGINVSYLRSSKKHIRHSRSGLS